MDIPQERKLVTEVPGPKSNEWFARRRGSVAAGVANIHPIVTARASGAIVEDVDGNRLIDFATGIAVLNVGHTAPDVVAAMRGSRARHPHLLPRDGERALHRAGGAAERPRPGPHAEENDVRELGAEAVENAVKIARYHGRSAIVTFDHAFHGRTLLAMTLTAKVMPYKQGHGAVRARRSTDCRSPTPTVGSAIPTASPRRRSRTRSTRCTSTSARRTSRR